MTGGRGCPRCGSAWEALGPAGGHCPRCGFIPRQEIDDRGGSLVSPPIREGGVGETNQDTKFFSAADLSAMAPEATPWLVKPWVVQGGITMVSGKAKLAGKTTWTLHLVRAVLDGGEFLGETAVRGPVIYLTEERIASFVDALRRADLADRSDLKIRLYNPSTPWFEVAAETIAEARRVGAGLIVVDTLAQFAGLPGDSENAAGDARSTLVPFADLGYIGVVLEFHDRKSGGEPGDSARGSSAFAGAVDIIIDLRRLGEGQERRREVVAVGRFQDIPDKVIIELGDDGYSLLGDTAAVNRRDAKLAIAQALKAGARTEQELAEELKDRVKRATLGKALRQMVGAGTVGRKADGKRGSPYIYFLFSYAPSLIGVGEKKQTAYPGNGLHPNDGPLVRYAVEGLGLRVIRREG